MHLFTSCVDNLLHSPVVSPVLSVSPPPCKDERFSVGMEEWTDSASKSPPSRSPTRPVTRKRQRYSKDVIDDDIYEEDQEFNVSITAVSPPSAVVIGSVSSVTKTLRDNQGTYMCFGVLGKLSN